LRTDRLNAETPVVFITTHADAVCRVEAENVGGTDFISKPFLPIEITVKALTLAYEQRLNARRVSPVREAEAAAA
jgi:FixJ family two-component response regulator